MASISNIFIDQGADFTTTVTVTDSSDSAVNLTGYSAAAQPESCHARPWPRQIKGGIEGDPRHRTTTQRTTPHHH